ncbi:MAG: sulfotransferase family protein [Gammaproteobacteria bacterium]|nr:sulfotransferase family protein [Gammaproteobacteria bacterium]
MATPICLWSGPRNVSTALMYSFAQRDDMRVIDEPLYGHYLRISGANHPGRDAIMASMNCDGNAVMQDLLTRQKTHASPRLFLKHMAHHLLDLDLGFLSRTSNVFLIRDPRDMLPSLAVQIPNAQLADTGLKRQSELYDDLAAAGQAPMVLDSRALLMDPAGVLCRLCSHLGIPFDSRMLRWRAGPRPEDGIWAPHWYDVVHRSTGFAPYRQKGSFPKRLKPLLAECQPWYERLMRHALRADTKGEQQ